ncbi:tigger transposable element-derived protein 4-like [Sycon ciliatum]|uniref:tigger transposable element-derived protein 4-like n=1 Tax=Sycon ciliatum TaxID=27933 RepID=UPI0031F64081
MAEQSLKRKRFSFAEKYSMIQDVDKGIKRIFVQEKYGVSHGTLAGFLKDRERIEDNVKSPTKLEARANRQSRYHEVDTALLEWFRNIRSTRTDTVVTGLDLLAKATTLAKKLSENHIEGYDNFSLDLNWIERWKKRHGVSCKQIVGESASADHASAKTWLDTQLDPIRQDYDDKDIFNADETGLFWKMSPEKTLAFKGETCKGGKHAKDRVTVLVATSADGEKLPLYVIGKSKRPHCFRGVLNIPVEYEANKKAWMTGQLFEQWCNRLNNRMVREGRRIALILDNFAGHPHLDLSNISIFFLPPNTTSMTQPMDAGIIKNLKHHYRRLLVKRRISCIDSDQECKITLLDAVQWLKTSWQQVTSDTVKNCYRHVGFQPKTAAAAATPSEDLPPDETEQEDASLWSAVCEAGLAEEGTSFDEFVNIDESVATGATGGLTDIELLADVLDTTDSAEIISSDSEEEDEDTSTVPKYNDVIVSLDTTLKYLRSIPESGDHVDAVEKAKQHCIDNRIEKLLQPRISSFFRKV